MLFQRKPRLDAVLRPLLEQARAMGAAERRVWLAELRADSPSVVSQLERLLATDAVDAGLGDLAAAPPAGSPEALGLWR